MEARVAGPVFLTMVLYEFVYTGIGQMIAVSRECTDPPQLSLTIRDDFTGVLTKSGLCIAGQPACHFRLDHQLVSRAYPYPNVPWIEA